MLTITRNGESFTVYSEAELIALVTWLNIRAAAA
jgi:hypothetical protein